MEPRKLIEPTPDPRDAVIARMVEAADTILRELRADSYAANHMPEGSRVALSAALAAAKEVMK